MILPLYIPSFVDDFVNLYDQIINYDTRKLSQMIRYTIFMSMMHIMNHYKSNPIFGNSKINSTNAEDYGINH